MGQVCAKNDAGKVATDAPRPSVKRNKELISSQTNESVVAKAESKFVAATINFNTDKGIEKKADQIAKETADAWCAENEGWEYTGEWKNERAEGATDEISHFEVSKVIAEQAKLVEQTTAADTNVEHTKRTSEEKKDVTDQKQSFVDQVSEGLQQKIPAERFEHVDEDVQDKPEAVKVEDDKAEAEKEEDAPEAKEDGEEAKEEAKVEDDQNVAKAASNDDDHEDTKEDGEAEKEDGQEAAADVEVAGADADDKQEEDPDKDVVSGLGNAEE